MATCTLAGMSDSPTRPSPKRIKLESSPASPRSVNNPSTLNDDDLGHDHCVICLQPLVDRTVIPTCSHEFCFECILIWAGEPAPFLIQQSVVEPCLLEQSQKCPLCSQLIGEYVIHHIRSEFDYQKHYLPPPRSSSPRLLPTGESRARVSRRARRGRYWGRRDRHDADELERAIAKRRWVYQNNLYAKVCASFRIYTRVLYRHMLACRVQLIHPVPSLPQSSPVCGISEYDKSSHYLSPP
jgi:hypothetical protein